jgi:hypothetical protein
MEHSFPLILNTHFFPPANYLWIKIKQAPGTRHFPLHETVQRIIGKGQTYTQPSMPENYFKVLSVVTVPRNFYACVDYWRDHVSPEIVVQMWRGMLPSLCGGRLKGSTETHYDGRTRNKIKPLRRKLFSAYKEPEVTVPCSQKDVIGPYPELVDSSSNLTPSFCKINLNVSSHIRQDVTWSPPFPTGILYA